MAKILSFLKRETTSSAKRADVKALSLSSRRETSEIKKMPSLRFGRLERKAAWPLSLSTKGDLPAPLKVERVPFTFKAKRVKPPVPRTCSNITTSR